MRRIPLLAALCLFLSPVLGANDAAANEGRHGPRGITVTGECLTKVAQDRGAVTVGSSSLSKDARRAAEEAFKAHEVIKADVAALKLKDAEQRTVATTVTEECTYPHDGKRVCTGYRATVSTRFETSDIPRLGDILAVAAKRGAEEISQLETFVSADKDKEAREACLEVATKNALRKAQKLASGAGVSLGKLEAINEGFEEPPVVSRFAQHKAFGDVAMAAAPSIDTQAEDLRVTVTAVYAIN